MYRTIICTYTDILPRVTAVIFTRNGTFSSQMVKYSNFCVFTDKLVDLKKKARLFNYIAIFYGALAEIFASVIIPTVHRKIKIQIHVLGGH